MKIRTMIHFLVNSLRVLKLQRQRSNADSEQKIKRPRNVNAKMK